MSTTTSHTLYIQGMHCAACVMRITNLLTEVGMSSVHVSLAAGSVSFMSSTSESSEVLAHRFTTLCTAQGYIFLTEPPQEQRTVQEWLIVIVVVTVLGLGFFFLNRLGVTSILSGRDASVGTALLVGLVASVSTCLAVVGGLVLSLGATGAQQGTGVRPQILFHVGRIVGFFVLGGLLGIIGSLVRIGVYGSTILSVVVSIIMLFLGVQLITNTSRVRVPTLSRSVYDNVMVRIQGVSGWGSAAIGVATFFLPCGFTQSMQVLALSSGSVVQGALIMSMFALGTFPVLALVSFGSLDLAQSRYKSVFFKSAGILVILFALHALYAALAIFGIM
jgi:uncharacterized protein